MDDEKLILKLGGVANLAEMLGYPKKGGVQRVDNWRRRGIPLKVRVEHPEIFGDLICQKNVQKK